MRRIRVLLLMVITPVIARADVFSSEFHSDPVSEGWDLVQRYCDPESWAEGGWFHQKLNFDGCGPPPEGAQEDFGVSIVEYNGSSAWFLEFRVYTTGPSSELPGQAPAPVTTGNFFGIVYGATVSSDQIKFFRDVDLPVLFIDVDPSVPHTIRLELYNGTTNTYRWYIDGEVIDEGAAEGAFPVQDSRIAWRGKAWFVPNETMWDYFRYGDIPIDGSGDFDSENGVTQEDYYFFNECAANSGPSLDAGPGCRWADMDGDSDVDLLDFALWQAAFDRG